MTMDGSSTIALLEILRVVGQRLHRSTLSVDLALETEHVFELGAAMLADIAEWKFADLHAMHHKRTRDAEDAGRVVGAKLLIFGKDRDPVAFEQVTEQHLDQRCGVWRQGQGRLTRTSILSPLPILPRRPASLRSSSDSSTNCRIWVVMTGLLSRLNIALTRSNCNK